MKIKPRDVPSSAGSDYAPDTHTTVGQGNGRLRALSKRHDKATQSRSDSGTLSSMGDQAMSVYESVLR